MIPPLPRNGECQLLMVVVVVVGRWSGGTGGVVVPTHSPTVWKVVWLSVSSSE